jgi:Fic family protein
MPYPLLVDAEGDAMPSSWPSVTSRTFPWARPDEIVGASRRQLRVHSGPYEASVAPQIATCTLDLPPGLVTDIVEASAAVTAFDRLHGDVVAPFAALLLRSESAASSQIENLTASSRAIVEAELGDNGRQNAALIVSNTRAMEAALADRLDGTAIIAMHRELLDATRPDWTGGWRQEQVWVGGSAYGPHAAEFVPPHHTDVPAAILDLVQFMARDDMPALVQAALAHAQFETIHPFPDGNGRVGRALVQAVLRSKQLVRGVTVPISAGLLQRKGAYFDALTAYRGGDPLIIVERFVEATFVALDSGTRLIDDLGAVTGGWAERITARGDAAAWRLAGLLRDQPIVSSALVQDRLGVSAPTADGAITRLVAADVLRQLGSQRRNRRWAADEILDALDAFAERARRGA